MNMKHNFLKFSQRPGAPILVYSYMQYHQLHWESGIEASVCPGTEESFASGCNMVLLGSKAVISFLIS